MQTPEIQIQRVERAQAQGAVVGMTRELLTDGTTYIFRPDTTEGELADYWFPPDGETFVASMDAEPAGCYFIRPNHSGRAAHIANASYFVSRSSRRFGVGKTMAQHSLREARAAGYLAMQFNLVVSTNHGAIALWKDLGFETLAVVPDAFDHAERGLTDVLVMHRRL